MDSRKAVNIITKEFFSAIYTPKTPRRCIIPVQYIESTDELWFFAGHGYIIPF